MLVNLQKQLWFTLKFLVETIPELKPLKFERQQCPSLYLIIACYDVNHFFIPHIYNSLYI